MATLTATTTTANDAFGYKEGASWPPTTLFTVGSDPDLYVSYAKFFSTYYNDCTVLRFDTSSLGSGATISSAVLKMYVVARTNTDGFSLTGEYFDYGGDAMVTGDHTVSIASGSSIFSAAAISGLSTSAYKSLTLTDTSGISKTGFTGIRLSTNGSGTPTGDNSVQFQSAGGANKPTLEVTYTSGGTTYTQTISATSTGTPAIVNQARLRLAATSSATAAIVKQAAIRVASSATGAGALVKQAAIRVAASSTGTAAVATLKAVLVTIAATATGTGALVKQAGIRVAGAATGTGALVKRVALTLASTSSATAALVKRAAVRVAASSTGTAAMASMKVALVTIAATATGTAAMVRRVSLTVAAAATGTPALVKRVAITITRTATGTAGLVGSLLSAPGTVVAAALRAFFRRRTKVATSTDAVAVIAVDAAPVAAITTSAEEMTP